MLIFWRIEERRMNKEPKSRQRDMVTNQPAEEVREEEAAEESEEGADEAEEKEGVEEEEVEEMSPLSSRRRRRRPRRKLQLLEAGAVDLLALKGVKRSWLRCWV